ncbi:MAG TPA: hypothetical protein VI279_07680 [Rhodocyclaceae bacterium]
MAAICSEDPIVCIDAVAMGIGEFLKDGTTMAMLAVLLVLLLRYRADQQKRKLEAYAASLLAYDQNKNGAGRDAQTWKLDDADK